MKINTMVLKNIHSDTKIIRPSYGPENGCDCELDYLKIV